MNAETLRHYIPDIVACLTPLEPDKIILFGSGARETTADVGDLDLIVVTHTDHLPQTHREKEAVYLPVAQALRPIRRRIPLDVIVHTRPMHAKFLALDSQFARRVRQEGEVLYESYHR
jgi:predicted nucleotidyltransferase